METPKAIFEGLLNEKVIFEFQHKMENVQNDGAGKAKTLILLA